MHKMRIEGSNPSLSAKPLAFMRVFRRLLQNPINSPINRASLDSSAR
jgi:hypothetical protein